MREAISPGTTGTHFPQATILQICQRPQHPAEDHQKLSLAKLGGRKNQLGGGDPLPGPVHGLGSRGRGTCATSWGETELFFIRSGL